jgi:hypothetical protein
LIVIRFFRHSQHQLPGNYMTPGTDGPLVKFSLDRVLDAFDEMMRQRLIARFPSYAGDSALALLGAARGILRGRAELASHYAQRLISWRYPRGHRVRGSGFALLEQISEYFGGGFDLNTEQHNALQFHRAADGTESTATVGGWDWDSGSLPNWNDRWARFWVVIDGTDLISATPDFGDANLYGGQLGDSSYAVGHEGVSADDVIAIRKLFRGRAWKPAGTRAMWAIISINGTTPNPGGDYERWGRLNATNYEAARDYVNQRYWALDPTALLYAGDPTRFALTSDMPGGGNYGGDDTMFPASEVFNGTTYAGNPDLFPTSAKLIDDGSIP